MFQSGVVRRIARRVAIGITGTTICTTSALTIYANTEQGLGFKREVQFWSNVGPIVYDYWWNSFSSSPKVKLQLALNDDNNISDDQIKENKKKVVQELHERNAPRIFNVMLDLGGLYIKLGQVLSVTALPIPEQYRVLFRTLQSNVPGASDFESVVKPTIEKELDRPINEVFESVDEIPCGAASIGQAHKARLKDTNEEVIIKVQYPNAKWQVPADIECVGQFLQLCVYFGVVDESAATLSYEEFARQFMAELDYKREKESLKAVYQSSLDPKSPYIKRGVLIPRVFDDLCTNQVITMTYLPGEKFEEEAKRQLKQLGIDTKRGIREIVKEAEETTNGSVDIGDELALSPDDVPPSWKIRLSRIVTNLVSVDSMFSLARFARRIMLLSTAAAVKSIQVASFLPIVPRNLSEWADGHQNAMQQAERLGWTKDAITTLLDVHGYQILNQGLFSKYFVICPFVLSLQ